MYLRLGNTMRISGEEFLEEILRGLPEPDGASTPPVNYIKCTANPNATNYIGRRNGRCNVLPIKEAYWTKI
ncbi:hypothetical protein NQ318_011171 [Aromia moschata]|uniref:Uncharacterized protein n=1 Tax=Aromia moschata TaxID=1265417 RepID=A0AAV8YHZ2_9CUCU|nr:hypothetical protein NQ318_011171 [Aromia moschata]